jgi:hypothetical protein
MGNETELEVLEDNQETVETEEEEESSQEESTEESESTEQEESAGETQEAEEKPDKTQKRIDKLTAVKKSLEEAVNERQDQLDKAIDRIKFLESELEKDKQSFGRGVTQIYTWNGKQMYELSEEEFDEVVDTCLSADDPKAARQQLEECRKLRRQGKPLLEQQNEVEAEQQKVWMAEWKFVTDELLKVIPELKDYVGPLSNEIGPIFDKRNTDKKAAFLYQLLTDGKSEKRVQSKLKYVNELMDELGISKKLQLQHYANDRPAPGSTVGKGKAPVTSKTPSFTRKQIEAMTLEQFEKYEAQIDAAQKAGRIR